MVLQQSDIQLNSNLAAQCELENGQKGSKLKFCRRQYESQCTHRCNVTERLICVYWGTQEVMVFYYKTLLTGNREKKRNLFINKAAANT